jgi:rusticyanin
MLEHLIAFPPGLLLDGRAFSYGRFSERKLRRQLDRTGAAKNAATGATGTCAPKPGPAHLASQTLSAPDRLGWVTNQKGETQMKITRQALVVGVLGLALGGTGVGVAFAVSGGPSPAAATSASGYSWYRSMMGRLNGGSMMGGAGAGMMGTSGYRWMMGATAAPGWMHGGSLPGFMMGASTDPGKVMGRLFASAPGPRVSPADAARLGNEVPAGATVDDAADRVSAPGAAVHLVVLASPQGGPDETFRTAGLVDPTITVQLGSRVNIELVNADAGTAHGLVVSANGSRSSWMPMMTARPAFSGAALWFLGDPTSVGMHAGTLSFTASTPGTYWYLCPVPGHAKRGMIGKFVVSG